MNYWHVMVLGTWTIIILAAKFLLFKKINKQIMQSDDIICIHKLINYKKLFCLEYLIFSNKFCLSLILGPIMRETYK